MPALVILLFLVSPLQANHCRAIDELDANFNAAVRRFFSEFKVSETITFRNPDDPNKLIQATVIGANPNHVSRVGLRLGGAQDIVYVRADLLENARHGISIPSLHDFGKDDLVKLVTKSGRSHHGRIIGYTADGDVIFVEQGASTTGKTILPRQELVKKYFVSKAPKSERLKSIGPASGTFISRPEEMPYRLPPTYIEVHPGRPINPGELKPGVTYLYVVRYDGVIVIAPENQFDLGFQRYVKHRDLIPAPNGKEGQPARFGGEMELMEVADTTKTAGKKWVLLIDGNSSYVFNRKDNRKPEGAKVLSEVANLLRDTNLTDMTVRVQPAGAH